MGTVTRIQAPEQKTGDVIRDSALGLVPETIEAIANLNRHVWRSGSVRASLLEIVRLRNARTVNCQFCKSVRYDLARRDGLTEDKVEQIRDGYEESLLSADEKLAIAFADAYLHDPGGMSKELAAHLKQHFSAGPTRPSDHRADRVQRHLKMRSNNRRHAGEPTDHRTRRTLEVILRGKFSGAGVPARHGSSRA